MRLAHLGHSAVLVETASARILIDPGNFSDQWHDLADLDAIVVTHAHPDHVDPSWLPRLLGRNRGARLLVEPSVPAVHGLEGAEAFLPGTTLGVGASEIAAVGGLHALIHQAIPQIGNIGIVIRTEGEPAFFHPGDALDTVPPGVDLIAAPAHGPWCAMKEIIDFVRQVGASEGFLIHDGLINERGWSLAFNRLNELTSTRFLDRRGRGLETL